MYTYIHEFQRMSCKYLIFVYICMCIPNYNGTHKTFAIVYFLTALEWFLKTCISSVIAFYVTKKNLEINHIFRQHVIVVHLTSNLCR